MTALQKRQKRSDTACSGVFFKCKLIKAINRLVKTRSQTVLDHLWTFLHSNANNIIQKEKSQIYRVSTRNLMQKSGPDNEIIVMLPSGVSPVGEMKLVFETAVPYI